MSTSDAFLAVDVGAVDWADGFIVPMIRERKVHAVFSPLGAICGFDSTEDAKIPAQQ